MSVALDHFLARHAPGPRVAIAPAILSARAALARASSDLRAVPDATLEADWPWRGSNADVRYGFYRILELVEEAAVDVSRALRESEGMSGLRRPRSGDLVALATAARWDLHGRLAVMDDDLLDRDPGGAEWNIRRTLAHIVNGHRAYAWYTAWWVNQRVTDPEALPPRVPDGAVAGLPEEEREGDGSLAEIRDRLDAAVDDSAEAFGGLGEGELGLLARWSGYPVTVAFRVGRWSSHLREHTVQTDKTLAAVGWASSEVDRLVGLIYAAYGHLEALVFAVPLGTLVAPSEDGRTADGILYDTLAAAETHAAEVRASADEAARKAGERVAT